MKRIAPNVNFFIYRPAMANPPLCSFLECECVTLRQLLDMHEILDLRSASAEKAQRNNR